MSELPVCALLFTRSSRTAYCLLFVRHEMMQFGEATPAALEAINKHCLLRVPLFTGF